MSDHDGRTDRTEYDAGQEHDPSRDTEKFRREKPGSAGEFPVQKPEASGENSQCQKSRHEALKHALPDERAADKTLGRPDKPHRMHREALGEYRKADRVADQHDRDEYQDGNQRQNNDGQLAEIGIQGIYKGFLVNDLLYKR